MFEKSRSIEFGANRLEAVPETGMLHITIHCAAIETIEKYYRTEDGIYYRLWRDGISRPCDPDDEYLIHTAVCQYVLDNEFTVDYYIYFPDTRVLHVCSAWGKKGD